MFIIAWMSCFSYFTFKIYFLLLLIIFRPILRELKNLWEYLTVGISEKKFITLAIGKKYPREGRHTWTTIRLGYNAHIIGRLLRAYEDQRNITLGKRMASFREKLLIPCLALPINLNDKLSKLVEQWHKKPSGRHN